eukprot:gnl/Ergobibamus_cyprinoides/547.p1 GENE.gnl/Ergobibamus_cyprinoides/547~~gnl/Ergobibamus_cyprinoides/547.p1  ORF type:complete len:316 (+),score=54.52 gnl/Ergobibamus_cyprinoides/547:73-1020(+)
MPRKTRDKRDAFYRLAKEQGWRARSAFKLIQLDSDFHLFEGVTRAVDLCAAPGSWSQVLSRCIYQNSSPAPDSAADSPLPLPAGPDRPILVSVDLNKMAPLPGVVQLQGDITKPETAEMIVSLFSGRRAQLVVCDGAPDVTGLHGLDEFLQAELVAAALRLAVTVLERAPEDAPEEEQRNTGTFVAKVFRGRDTATSLYAALHAHFYHVAIAKPRASRNASLEAFVVARGLRRVPLLPTAALAALEPVSHELGGHQPWQLAPCAFTACGDLSAYSLDSDGAYSVTEVVPQQSAPPEALYAKGGTDDVSFSGPAAL